MEDGYWLSEQDKKHMEALKKELLTLKAEHKSFAKNKGRLSPEDREKWRINSHRTNQVYIEIKELRCISTAIMSYLYFPAIMSYSTKKA